jgi:glycosyltransferase involved in cell wall biosynthesis
MAWPAFRSENPYNVHLYREMQHLGAVVTDFSPGRLLITPPDILHLHWPEIAINGRSRLRALVRGSIFLLLVAAARLRGVRVVWTVHSVQAHERDHPWLEPWFWRGFTRLLSGYTTLSHGGGEAARRRFAALSRIPEFVIPHGHFRGTYPDAVGAAEARSRLGISADAAVYGFLGQIRPYKNVPHLIQAFRRLPDAGARLIIAGRPDSPATRQAVEQAAHGDGRILSVLEHVPDDRIQLYLRASDVIVLPFTDVLNSGSALLALAFDRPVVVPLLGAMGELQAAVGDAWVRTFSGALTAETLEDAVQWARGRPRDRCRALDHLSWASIARKTLDAYVALPSVKTS